jgi:thymidylate synthase
MDAITHELLWFISGDTNIQYLVENGVNIWNDDAYNFYKKKNSNTSFILTKESFIDFIKRGNVETVGGEYRLGDLGPVYGAQWRKWQSPEIVLGKEVGMGFYSATVLPASIDQLEAAINAIKNNPEGRRIIVSAWNPGDLADMALPPCHAFFQFNCEEISQEERYSLYMQICGDNGYTQLPPNEAPYDQVGTPRYYLDCQLYQRSCDVMLGVPFNWASYALLMHMIAQVTNTVAREFIWTGGDTHIYANHLDKVDEIFKREIRRSPTLKLNPAVRSIDGFKFSDVEIVDYNPHPYMKLPLST